MIKKILGSGFAEPLNVTICEDNNSISQLSLKSAFVAVAMTMTLLTPVMLLADCSKQKVEANKDGKWCSVRIKRGKKVEVCRDTAPRGCNAKSIFIKRPVSVLGGE